MLCVSFYLGAFSTIKSPWRWNQTKASDIWKHYIWLIAGKYLTHMKISHFEVNCNDKKNLLLLSIGVMSSFLLFFCYVKMKNRKWGWDTENALDLTFNLVPCCPLHHTPACKTVVDWRSPMLHCTTMEGVLKWNVKLLEIMAPGRPP